MYYLIVLFFVLNIFYLLVSTLYGNKFKNFQIFLFGQIVFYGLMFNGLAIADEIIILIFIVFNALRMIKFEFQISKFKSNNITNHHLFLRKDIFYLHYFVFI